MRQLFQLTFAQMWVLSGLRVRPWKILARLKCLFRVGPLEPVKPPFGSRSDAVGLAGPNSLPILKLF